MDPLLAFAIGFFGTLGAFLVLRSAIERVRSALAMRRRLRQSASTKATTAKATTNPPAKIKTRIISDKPFVLLRTP